MPDSMRDPLSKMYYNYGQSLQRTEQISAAIEAAIARREVWRGNGQRLFGVAVELAEIVRSGATGLSTDEMKKLHAEIIATLAASRDTGWEDQLQLAEDDRFAFLRENEQFQQLMTSRVRSSSVAESAKTDD
jgi:hypothetical protein